MLLGIYSVNMATMAATMCFNLKDYLFDDIRTEFLEDLLKNEGDFLVQRIKRKYELVVLWQGKVRVYQPIFNGVFYTFEPDGKEFVQFDELIAYYSANELPIGKERAVLKKLVGKSKTTYEKSDIEIIKQLGQGNFGEVFLVKIKSEDKFAAMKTLKGDVSAKAREQFVKEFEMMQTMKHENVVGCLGVVADKDSKQMKILLEMINKGSLDKLLKESKLTERGKSRILLDVCRGMAYLHKRHIIHRDLAARNILVHRNPDTSVTGKVSDFGLSQTDQRGEGYELKDSEKLPIKWCAPECMSLQKWTTASDVWSFGVLMWEVYTDGADPYSDIPEAITSAKALINFIKEGGHPSKPKNMPDHKLKIMWSCFHADPSRRPSMEQILSDLEKAHRIYRQLNAQKSTDS